MEKNSEVKDWDNYASVKFLKAKDVKDYGSPETVEFKVTGVDNHISEEDNDEKLRLTLTITDETFQFDLNKTNTNFLRDLDIPHPKDMIGKTLKFDIVQAFSPKEKKYVDSLRIKSVS
jgi:hypothetical protein